MKQLAAGDIILVKFPFANLREAKKRPALILRTTSVTSKASLVTIAMITSQVDGLELEGDVLVSKWKEVTLLHPSLVRLSKIATVDSELIDRKLGVIAESDQKHVSRTFKKLYAQWI
jgi:mRNA interferase MazF